MTRLSLGLVVLHGVISAACAQPCGPQWSGGFSQDGPSARVNAVAEFDPDGAGPLPPALVIGGEFRLVGSRPMSRVAMWDGVQWREMGSGLPGIVRCLSVVDPDGTGPEPVGLYAGGSFFASQIYRWSGENWHTVGGSFASSSNTDVRAIASFDDDASGPNFAKLYVAGSIPSGHMARYDGVSWGPAAPPLDQFATAMRVFDVDAAGPQPPSLVVGGRMQSAGSTSVSCVARWTGSAWVAMGNELINEVQSLEVLDPDGGGPAEAQLFAGGTLAPAQGTVARWDGAQWVATGNNFVGGAMGLSTGDVDGPGPLPVSLIAMGAFGLSGSPTTPVSTGFAAYLHNGTWLPIGEGFNTITHAGCTWDPDGSGPLASRIVVGGFFVNAVNSNGPATFTPRVAQWDGDSWEPMGPNGNRGLNDIVYALAVHAEGGNAALIAGGDFSQAGGIAAERIARWDGTAWSNLGTFDAGVRTLLSFDGLLYAGGRFTEVNGAPVNRVAAWNGQSWSSLGDGAGGIVIVRRLVVADPDGAGPTGARPFVMGDRSVFLPGPSALQSWDGTAWIEFPDIGFRTMALVEFDLDGPGPQGPVLVAGGADFVNAAVGRVGAWNGQQWTDVGTITTTPFTQVEALAVFDADGTGPNPTHLYAGGTFPGGVLRWTGTAWTSAGTGLSGDVRDLVVADDDNDGSASLFAVGGVGVQRLVGSTWVAVGANTNDFVFAWASFDEDGAGPRLPAMYAGGRFSVAGGLSSQSIARWGCGDPYTCYANCDLSAVPFVLSANDFVCFLSKFASGDPYANCDGSTTAPALNAGDFQCFLNAFAAGCP